MDSNFLSIIASGFSATTPSRPPPLSVAGGLNEAPASGSVPPLEWGPSLVLIRNHMAVCGGQYGKNNSFCCVITDQAGGGCSVSKHSVFKHPFTSDPATLQSSRLYYHKGKKTKAAFAEPFLDLREVNDQELVTLMSTVYSSWDEWKEAVLVCRAAAVSNQPTLAVQTAVKTSKKLPKLGTANPSGDSAGRGLLWRPTLTERMDSLEDVLEKLKLLELDTVTAIKGEEGVEGRQTGIESVVELLREAILELNGVAIEGMKEVHLGFGVRLKGLEETLGKFESVETQLQKEGMSVLGMIEDLQIQLDGLRSEEFAKSLVKQLLRSDEMKSFADGIKAAFEGVRDQFVDVHHSLTRLTTEEKKDAVSDVMSVSSWFVQQPGSKTEPGYGGQPMMNEAKSWKEVAEALAGRIDNVEASIIPGSKSEGEDILVSFKGMRFANERDVKVFVKSFCGGKFDVAPGLIMDAYAIFHNLNREIFDSKSKLTVVDLARVSAMGMLQADVHNVLAGVEHGVPDFFDPPSSGGKIYIDGKHGKKHRFSNIPSHEIWGPIGTRAACVRKQAETQLTRLVATKRTAIEDEIAHAELKAFLIGMLDASKDFVTAVFTFLTEEYSSLTQHFCDGAVCWDFACSCVEHVFKYEFEAARSILSNPDVGNPDIGSKLMWQSLRTISVQESFLRVGFKNHSSLSSAYSRFLLTQYQQTSLELNTMSKEMEIHKRKVAELSTALDAVEKRLKAAEGTANAAQNAVQKFKKGGA